MEEKKDIVEVKLNKDMIKNSIPALEQLLALLDVETPTYWAINELVMEFRKIIPSK